jgi:acetoacetyl-CoA reductase
VIDEAIANFGRLDILVANAGINKDKTLKRMSVEDWDDVITTDLSSAFYCVSAAIPHMTERNYGRIIVMSSIIGQMGNLGQSNYAAAKAGLIAFAKSAAKELARNNITVNAMCPGFVETDMVIALSDEVKAALLKNIPLGRFGKPEEVASFVRYLCTEGDWITGQQFNPNGGQYM